MRPDPRMMAWWLKRGPHEQPGMERGRGDMMSGVGGAARTCGWKCPVAGQTHRLEAKKKVRGRRLGYTGKADFTCTPRQAQVPAPAAAHRVTLGRSLKLTELPLFITWKKKKLSF